MASFHAKRWYARPWGWFNTNASHLGWMLLPAFLTVIMRNYAAKTSFGQQTRTGTAFFKTTPSSWQEDLPWKWRIGIIFATRRSSSFWFMFKSLSFLPDSMEFLQNMQKLFLFQPQTHTDRHRRFDGLDAARQIFQVSGTFIHGQSGMNKKVCVRLCRSVANLHSNIKWHL